MTKSSLLYIIFLNVCIGTLGSTFVTTFVLGLILLLNDSQQMITLPLSVYCLIPASSLVFGLILNTGFTMLREEISKYKKSQIIEILSGKAGCTFKVENYE